MISKETILIAFGVFLLVFSSVVILAPRGAEEIPPSELKEVSVQFVWVPNGQFAGIYVADQMGYYREEGIRIIYREYTADRYVKDIVASGGADFGIDGADQVIIGRSEGQPLVAVAVIYRINPLGYASMSDLGRRDPRDYAGKRIGHLPDNSALLFKTMISKVGLGESNITWVDYDYDLDLFYKRDIDVIPIYITDEVYEFQERGLDVDILVPEDYGISFYGDTIFTTEEMIVEKPELVEGFLRATLKGWRYALENPIEAAEITRLYDDEDYGEREEFIITASSPLIHTGENRVGWMELEEWESIQEVLVEQGIIREPIELEEAFTTEFLNRL
jgi:ABC-type nitrate/sulfonate/bicarbonate transport system substrate-binding protein